MAGLDPDTGRPRGRLRTDDRAVRFVEVVVNGPKSWSLAAALHPDVAAAYDAAQDRAADADHRLAGRARHHPGGAARRAGAGAGRAAGGGDGAALHLPGRGSAPASAPADQRPGVRRREMARAAHRRRPRLPRGDQRHRARRGRHATRSSGPRWPRTATPSTATGEILELAEYVGAFSARAAQIGRNVDRYERGVDRRAPRRTPGPALRRAWDARAWAEGRPDKVTPQPGADLDRRWRGRAAPPWATATAAGPVDLSPTPVGALDRDAAVETVLARLAAGRSAWNAADIRGEVERLIAAAGIVADAAVRIELAEDLTARALDRCVPLLDRDGSCPSTSGPGPPGRCSTSRPT